MSIVDMPGGLRYLLPDSRLQETDHCMRDEDGCTKEEALKSTDA